LINVITGLIGCVLVGYGLFAALINGSPYWYSYFVSGLFLLLDRCDARLNHDSNLTRLFNQNWHTPVYTYLVYLAGALILDLLLGSHIGNLWVYPQFDRTERLINVILIGYPLAFFSCAALYRVLFKLLDDYHTNLVQDKHKTIIDLKALGNIILFITIIATCFPILYFFIFGKMHIQGITIICCLLGIFSLSPITLLLRQDSLLERILNTDCSALIALLISIPLNALTHELPNTFAREWHYQNMPFTSLEILGIPVIILTVGWTYLTIFGISGNELFFNASH
jgi:hypothetical protein